VPRVPCSEYLKHDVLPSAPLRAFSYTQASSADEDGLLCHHTAWLFD
jgi:hypothetical protein